MNRRSLLTALAALPALALPAIAVAKSTEAECSPTSICSTPWRSTETTHECWFFPDQNEGRGFSRLYYPDGQVEVMMDHAAAVAKTNALNAAAA
jgi:hypothetical protein